MKRPPGAPDPEREARGAALSRLERGMRRARFLDRLPEEERGELTIIIGRGKGQPAAVMPEDAVEDDERRNGISDDETAEEERDEREEG